MKFCVLLLACIALFPQQFLLAQEVEDDPLADTRVIRRGGDEIIGIAPVYDSNTRTYRLTVEVSKYFTASEATLTDTVFRVLSYAGPVVDTRDISNYDITTLDADADGLSEIAAAWAVDSTIEITLLKANPYKLVTGSEAGWADTSIYQFPTPDYFHPGGAMINGPLLTSGDYDGDGIEDLAVAYLSGDSTGAWTDSLKLNLIGLTFDDSLRVTGSVSLIDQDIVLNHSPTFLDDRWNQPMRLFELNSGDFDGDGKEEILLAGREAVGPGGGWNLFVNLYSYDAGMGQWQQKLHEPIYARPDTATHPEYELLDIIVKTGFFNSTDSEQAVIGVTQFYRRSLYTQRAEPYMMAASFDGSLSRVTTSELLFAADTSTSNYLDRGYTANSIEIADINGDGLDEIVSVAGEVWSAPVVIYQLNQGLEFNEYASINFDEIDRPGYYADPIFTFGDVITDSAENRYIPELIYNQLMFSFDIGEDGSYQDIQFEERFSVDYGCWYPGGDAPYNCSSPMIAADLEGDVRLGTPRRSSITEILQPLVILNAPPIHFDVFGSQVHDVSQMYNDNESKFMSSYQKQSSESREVTTEFNKDWGISGTLSAEASYFGVSVSAYLTATYGEQFSKQQGSSSTVTVNIDVDAIEDDRIYATVLDYDVWEYPVYSGDKIQGHVLVVEPVMSENRWFPSKSWSGYSYIPEHEVGNILSYREYAKLEDNPAVDENGFIKGDYNNSFVLDGNSSYGWSLEFQDFQSSGATTQKEYGMEWGGSIGGWGVKLAVDGHYSEEQIRTQRSEVSEGLLLEVHLDALDLGLGEVSYRVTPYAYWADNGALVVDYAVQPELAQPGGTDTWWQKNYNSHSDPAFIMPWRYDPEKGFTLEDPVKRHQTKDITFFPEEPDAGDTVRVTARIHNFSLVNTPEEVGISFYIGDPDNGGQLIESIDGETRFHTQAAIPSRGMEIVSMQMEVPANVGMYPRIYGLIDPEQAIPQIHENNNKAWSILGKTTNSVNIDNDGHDNLPVVFDLQQNYPNPFNPSTTVNYSIAEPGMVTLAVYNILGKKVATLVSEHREPGSYSSLWDAGSLASGLYLYRLTSGDRSKTRKMMLIK